MVRLKRGLTLIPLIWLAAFLAGCGGGSSGPNLPGDFTLALSPNSVKMAVSSQATVTITITPQNGFSGSVTPYVTGLPTGVTGAFSPSPATSTTTLTLTSSPTADTGKSVLTITGVSGNVASTATLTLTISPGSGGFQTFTALTSSVNPSVYGQAVTFTATVTSQGSPLPSSTNGELISFRQKAIDLGEGTLTNGVATLTTSTLAAGGTDTITAVYEGDANYSGSTSNPVSQVVNLAPTTTTLVSLENPANVGQPVTFSATVSSSTGAQVTGSVGFYDGTTKIGNTALSNGVATFSITNSEASGATETITAGYDGTTDTFAASTSAPVTQVWGTGTTVDVCGSPTTNYGCPTNFQWNNVYRAFEVFVPTALPANPAIVIMLHGTQIDGGSDPSDPLPIIQLMWGWQTVADYYGFILVKPASTYDATSNQWNWNSYCMDGTSLCDPYGSDGGAFAYAADCGSADGECPDDSGFLRSLIESLLDNQNNGFPYGNFTANPKTVYVTGFSSGAQMTERVGVEISDLVASIIPASGPFYNIQGTNPQPPLPLPGNVVAPPISVQEWHGTADEELPPCSGEAASGTNGTTAYSGVIFTLETVDDTFYYWTGSQANNFTSQNAVFQIQTTSPPSPILCTTVSGSNLTGSNYLNDVPTPPYPEPPNVPVMPPTLTGNIAVSTLPPSGQWPSAVPITAASESGTTVTITSTLNPGVGGVAIVTGMTPSQYNGTWVVTGSTSTSFTYTAASGLADATGFGAAQGGQTTEVQFIWEPNITHSYQEQYDWARWLFFASHPKP
jgi:poly(3-hydroxybutyrate) depolymerase